jgi:hypothetical protein
MQFKALGPILLHLPDPMKIQRLRLLIMGLHIFILLGFIPAIFYSPSTHRPVPKVIVKTLTLNPERPPKKIAKLKDKPSKTKKTPPSQDVKKALHELDKISSLNAIEPMINTPLVNPDLLEVKIASYEEQLVAYLRQWLKLPEYGSVTIELTLNREGRVLALKILSSESEINAKWIKQHLMTLTLPSFRQAPKNLNEKTLILVLSNHD